VGGRVYALDIDGTMLAIAAERAEKAQRNNIEFIQRDFVSDGTGLPEAGAGRSNPLTPTISRWIDPVGSLASSADILPDMAWRSFSGCEKHVSPTESQRANTRHRPASRMPTDEARFT